MSLAQVRYARGWAHGTAFGRALFELTPWHKVLCRAGDFWPGIKSPMPAGPYGGDLASLCRAEAQALWNQYDELLVAWSGGIDSTLLACLLAECQPAGTVLNLCSEATTLGWVNHHGLQWLLDKGCQTVPLTKANLEAVVARGGMVVTGYHADTLLSGDMVRYNDLYERIWSMDLVELFMAVSKLPEAAVKHHLKVLQPLLDLCPLPQTAANVAWWLDYTCAWDSDEMMFKYHQDIAPPGVGYVNFYGAESLQRWAVQDAEQKLGKTKATHKQAYLAILADILGFMPDLPHATEFDDSYGAIMDMGKVLIIHEDWSVTERAV